MEQDIRDFLFGGGARAFPFEKPGDSVEGEILSAKMRQQTSLEDGKPLYWDNGDPRMMLVVVLQTTLHDDEEDAGERSLYIRGGNFTVADGKGSSSLQALKDALRKAGVTELETGGWLKMTFSGMGAKRQGAKAFNAPKLYVAEYKPPTTSIGIDQMIG